jgi:hypothetical protein
MEFRLTLDQLRKLEEWTTNLKIAYTGAIGGSLTFCFTPTGVGMMIRVKYNVTGASLDLSDYDM